MAGPPLLEAVLGFAAIGFAAEVIRVRRREKAARERFRELENLAHAFAEAAEIEGIAARAHEAMARLGLLEKFDLYLFDEDGCVREVWSSPDGEPHIAPRSLRAHPLIHAPFEREQLDRLTGTETAHSFAPLHLQIPRRGRRKFFLPLFSGSHPVGYWELAFTSPLPRIGLESLRAVYRYLSDAVCSERNFRLAARDGLSNLFARRYFDARLRGEIARAMRYRRPLSVAAFDLDHFKALNDRHGHALGDDAIRQFARVLQEGLREQDLCGRRGGEEFAAYFPETRAAEAAHVCERIRARLENEPLAREGAAIPLTVSIGVTELASGDSVERVLDRSDAALYDAKAKGRNRVIVIS